MSDTKQINVRLPVELHKALDDHKTRTGEDKSEIVRRGVEHILGIPTSYRAVDHLARVIRADKERANGKAADTVELAAWLSGVTGIPRALMRRRITEKRVTVDGEVFTDDRLEKTRLGNVSVDGEPVRARPGS